MLPGSRGPFASPSTTALGPVALPEEKWLNCSLGSFLLLTYLSVPLQRNSRWYAGAITLWASFPVIPDMIQEIQINLHPGGVHVSWKDRRGCPPQKHKDEDAQLSSPQAFHSSAWRQQAPAPEEEAQQERPAPPSYVFYWKTLAQPDGSVVER